MLMISASRNSHTTGATYLTFLKLGLLLFLGYERIDSPQV
jgi:hypothetical protein